MDFFFFFFCGIINIHKNSISNFMWVHFQFLNLNILTVHCIYCVGVDKVL